MHCVPYEADNWILQFNISSDGDMMGTFFSLEKVPFGRSEYIAVLHKYWWVASYYIYTFVLTSVFTALWVNGFLVPSKKQ